MSVLIELMRFWYTDDVDKNVDILTDIPKKKKDA